MIPTNTSFEPFQSLLRRFEQWLIAGHRLDMDEANRRAVEVQLLVESGQQRECDVVLILHLGMSRPTPGQRAGRGPDRPSDTALKRFGTLPLLVYEIRAALPDRGARFTDDEIGLLARMFVNPMAAKSESSMLGQMFADARDELIEALPKIKSRLEEFLDSAVGAILMAQAGLCEIERKLGIKFPQCFVWSDEATVSSGRFSRLGATWRTIEGARAKIRDLVSR